MSAANSSIASAKRIKQKRSQKTYDALIETCFAMLEHHDRDDDGEHAVAERFEPSLTHRVFPSRAEKLTALRLRSCRDRGTTHVAQPKTAVGAPASKPPESSDRPRRCRGLVKTLVGRVALTR
jgi:hypothetical protein